MKIKIKIVCLIVFLVTYETNEYQHLGASHINIFLEKLNFDIKMAYRFFIIKIICLWFLKFYENCFGWENIRTYFLLQKKKQKHQSNRIIPGKLWFSIFNLKYQQYWIASSARDRSMIFRLIHLAPHRIPISIL